MFNSTSRFFALLSIFALTLGILPPPSALAAPGAGSLVKGSQSTVYYLADDGGRYYFPNSKIYFTWYENFDSVIQITDAELANYALKGNVNYRAGKRLIKIESDPKVYAVDSGGRLRWVPTEERAIALFGPNWAKQVDDIPVSFFSDYQIAESLEASAAISYDPVAAADSTPTISANIQKRLEYRGQQSSNTTVNNPDIAQGGSGGGSGGSSGGSSGSGSSSSSAQCGNGVREGSEQCDGSDLNSASCSSRGFASGTLSCSSSCTFVTSSCSNSTPDVTAPSVSWSSPSNGATVSDSITLTATATDAVGVSSVKFQIGNTVITTDSSSPYTTSYDTTAVSNGSYTLYAVAKDAANNYATSTRSITVSNSTPDVTAPSVSWSAPSNGATVSGAVTLTATATDAVGVSSVKFLIDNTVITTDISSPYTVSYNTTAVSNGSYTLYAVAKDAANNYATSTRTITVNNSVGSAGQCNDGIDNDGDGLTDWGYDLGCVSSTDTTEGGLATGSRDNGWTVVEPSNDTRIIYVSDSVGDDSNDGLSPAAPKKTVSAGLALLRNGYPDWVLFKRGDTWTDGFGQWRISGRSASEPMVVAAYGDGARPRFETAQAMRASGSGGAPASNSYLYFMSLDFEDTTRNPANGAVTLDGASAVSWTRGATDLLIEDSRFSNFGTGLNFQTTPAEAPIDNVHIYRSAIYDNWTTPDNGHAQGMFLLGVTNFVIEESLYDRNGWNPDVPEATPTIFNHNLYLQQGTDGSSSLLNNLILRGSSHGAQMRSGGTASGNFFGQNAIGLLLGGGTSPNPGGVYATVLDNVVLQSGDILPREGHSGSIFRGGGIDLGDIASAEIDGNIIAHCVGTSNCDTLIVNAPNTTYGENLAYDWPNRSGSLVASAGPFTDPDRTVETYMTSLGLTSSFSAFADLAREQRKGSWDTRFTAEAVNDYIRAGFTPSP